MPKPTIAMPKCTPEEAAFALSEFTELLDREGAWTEPCSRFIAWVCEQNWAIGHDYRALRAKAAAYRERIDAEHEQRKRDGRKAASKRRAGDLNRKRLAALEQLRPKRAQREAIRDRRLAIEIEPRHLIAEETAAIENKAINANGGKISPGEFRERWERAHPQN
jgi:hypothetical protein